jgi:hypothetical protein
MPTYEFIDNTTQEVYTKRMSVAAMEEYLAENKHIQINYSSAPALADSVRLGIRKPDQNFRDMLKHISKRAGRRSTIKYD